MCAGALHSAYSSCIAGSPIARRAGAFRDAEDGAEETVKIRLDARPGHPPAPHRQLAAKVAIHLLDDMPNHLWRFIPFPLLVLPHGLDEVDEETGGGVVQHERRLPAIDP